MKVRRYKAPQYAPEHTHLKNAIKGGDPYYRIGSRKTLFRSYAVLLFILLFAVFGSIAVVALVAN